MFDKEALKNRDKETKTEEKTWGTTLSGLNLHELMALRAQIDANLPSTAIIDMDLSGELMLQYLQTKTLLASIIDDEGTPANQKAQVINTCSAILGNITKTQTQLYNAERLKIIEQCLMNALKATTKPVQEKFFENYSRELEVLGSND